MIRDALVEALREALDALGVEPMPEIVQLERPARPSSMGTGRQTSHSPAGKRAGRDRASWLLAGRAPDGRSADHVRPVELAGPGFVNFYLARTPGCTRCSTDVAAGRRRRLRPTEPANGVANGSRSSSCRRTRPVRSTSATAGSCRTATHSAGCWSGAARGRPRVLRQRHRRTDPPARRERLAWANGEPLPEGGYPGAFIKGLAVGLRGPSRGRGRRTVGCRTHPRAYQAPDEGHPHRLRRMVQPSVDRGQRGGGRNGGCAARPRVWCTRRTAQRGCARRTTAIHARSAVLRKSDGDYTYLAGDLAYHRNKFLGRGFDRVINVWGADHHGQVASLKAGIEALGSNVDGSRCDSADDLARQRPHVEASRQRGRSRRPRRRHRSRRDAPALTAHVDRPARDHRPRQGPSRVA